MKTTALATLAATALPMLAGEKASPSVMRNRDICATALVMEAGGEGRIGMELVWQVAWERVASKRWPDTPVKVLLQSSLNKRGVRVWQFSCFNNVSLGRAITTAQKHPRWRDALGIVSAPPVYRPSVNARGCNHYHATYINKPYWARGVGPQLTYKRHHFYRLEN